MSGDRIVQFGHSDTERLVLSHFALDDISYSLNADLRAGNFGGGAGIYGHVTELIDLHASLKKLSQELSGEATFENLEGQLNLLCAIGTLGAVHVRVLLRDHPHQLECSFDTDLTNLDSAIASLANVPANIP